MFTAKPKDPLDLADPAAMEVFDPDATQEIEPFDAEDGDILVFENGKTLAQKPMLTLEYTPQPPNLVFYNDDGQEIGKFEYDMEAKTWRFTGNADESAKEFAKFMAAHFQSIIEGRDGL